MSRELLKRVIAECSDEESRSNIPPKLYGAIAEYLEMPEPEPVASINGWYGGYPTVCSINGAVLPVGMALYPHAPARLPLQTPHTTQIDQSARIAELEDQLTKYRKLLATRVEASRLSEANEQLADQSALIVELKAALQLAKDMMIANDLSLPRTFEVIDEALAKAKGDL